MDAFVFRKRPRQSEGEDDESERSPPKKLEEDLQEHGNAATEDEEHMSTEFKLAVLASLNPTADHSDLLEALLACHGSVEAASKLLEHHSLARSPSQRSKSSAIGYQASLSAYNIGRSNSRRKAWPLTKKGQTLHLYSPQDIEQHTPCSIIHNFLPAEDAEALLGELLPETPSFKRDTFKLFDRVVQSPHTMCFYVDSWDEAERQKSEYIYNGSRVGDVRRTLPVMRRIAGRVQDAVNHEVERRIRDFYPEGKKLRYQSPDPWRPNAAFVNCYDGGQESVGYHSDQLTYLGPRALIGSLSLGVAREFRVRKIIAQDEDSSNSDNSSPSHPQPNGKTAAATTTEKQTPTIADAQGQIAIHLPHNSLLIMHAEMQEEWKHSIAPAAAITPHPLAGNKRINITYRHYKPWLHPRYTPRCRCDIPCVLRCVQRKKENRGRYMWMCHANYAPTGKEGCGYFVWAEFDDDGFPPWAGEEFKRCKDGGQGDGGVPGPGHDNEIHMDDTMQ
jgi:alkylated DNA repair dioxygenase AlkB